MLIIVVKVKEIFSIFFSVFLLVDEYLLFVCYN